MTGEGMINKEWLDELAAASEDELIEKLRFFSCDPYFYDLFDPLVEEIQKRLNKAEPVRRGRWIDNKCSLCGQHKLIYKVIRRGETVWETEKAYLYCPNCGAKMEEQE